jgi:hypothetical protein
VEEAVTFDDWWREHGETMTRIIAIEEHNAAANTGLNIVSLVERMKAMSRATWLAAQKAHTDGMIAAKQMGWY